MPLATTLLRRREGARLGGRGGLCCLLGRGPDQVAVIFAHGLAALRSGRVDGIALQLRDEEADILHALGVEPIPFDAAPDGEEIRLGLVGALELMPAFMREDVELGLGRESN